MYAIFKDKNCKVDTRTDKYKKARPITPYCKHPMKVLFKRVARAWMFFLRQLKGNHFSLTTTNEFKDFVQKSNEHFRKLGKKNLTTKSWDISGCYPSMPKNEVLHAMQTIIDRVLADPDLTNIDGCFAGMKSPAITAKTRTGAVNVPKSGKDSVLWGHSNDPSRITITTKNMMDVVKFCLDNAFFTLDGQIIQQYLKASPWETRLARS